MIIIYTVSQKKLCEHDSLLYTETTQRQNRDKTGTRTRPGQDRDKTENDGDKTSTKYDFNPSLVGGGHKVVAPSFTSSSAVNIDFYDSKPE